MITLPSQRTFKPRAYDGFYLDVAARLDAACPNFLNSSFHASALKRQAQFCCFSEVDLSRPQIMAARLRKAASSDSVASVDPLAQIARSLVVLKARAIVEAVYGAVPYGLLSLFARLGPDPIEHRFYRTAFNLFADPGNRTRADVLLQTQGQITGQMIEIVARLDSALARKAVVNRVRNDIRR